jgi:hypothetical protein
MKTQTKTPRRFIEIVNICGQLEPATWDDNDIPVTYETEAEAQTEVTDHMFSAWEAIKDGFMEFGDVEQPSIHECDVREDGSITIGHEYKTTWSPYHLKQMRGISEG